MRDIKKLFSSLLKIPPRYWGTLASVCINGCASVTEASTINLFMDLPDDVERFFKKAGFFCEMPNRYDLYIALNEEEYNNYRAKKYGIQEVSNGARENIDNNSLTYDTPAKNMNVSNENRDTKSKKKKIIPFFLDYSGTTDKMIEDGEHALDNIKAYITETNKLADELAKLDSKHEYEVQTYIVTGCSRAKAKEKIIPFYQIARNAGCPNLFAGAVAEYCGYKIAFNPDMPRDKEVRADDTTCFIENPLVKNNPVLEENREKIEAIINNYDENARITPDVKSMLNVVFDDISEEDFYKAIAQVKEFLGEDTLKSLIVTDYYDEYGIECDFAPLENTKPNAILMMYNNLTHDKGYDIPFIVIGGDSQTTDAIMYTKTKDKLPVNSIFLAPANIGELEETLANDSHVIKSQWENAAGIVDGVTALAKKMYVRTNESEEEVWDVR